MAKPARSIANRAVHLRITPRPSNISDSREILRLVSQFGEVEYYKSLKYDTLSHPSASLVVFRDESAAEQCLKRSPIRFRLGPAEADVEDQFDPFHDAEAQRVPAPEPTATQSSQPPATSSSPKGPLTTPFGMAQTRSLSTHSLPDPPRAPPAMPFMQPSPTPNSRQPASRIFQLQTNRARTNFRDSVDRAEYHGRFMIDGKSAIQQDLARKVPALGMSCWEWRKPEKPDRMVQSMRKGEERKSLAQVWEEGRRPEEM